MTADAPDRPQRIAVVGAGVAGLTTAYLLGERHRVTLFEKNGYLGGHTNTILIPDGPDAGTPVDTGFIVLNNHTYPLLQKLLARLHVPTRDSDMSFGFSSEVSGLAYAGTGIPGLFAQPRNLVSLRHWAFLREIMQFCRQAREDLRNDYLAGHTMASYLQKRGYTPLTVRSYILPMAAAIWSASHSDVFDFPAEMLIRFWENHGLLSIENRPTWMTIAGGSHSYVRRMLETWTVDARVGAEIQRVTRGPAGPTVHFRDGAQEAFDLVVMASHADETLALLSDADDDERRLLGPWRYQPNEALLHHDERIMPRNRRAWASWNFTERPGAGDRNPVAVTYHMNRLQGLRTQRQYFVTLNDPGYVREECVVRRIAYTHPQFSLAAMRTQGDLPRLQGRRGTYFCGSYHGYGFHEDAVRSGVAVARLLGGEL